MHQIPQGARSSSILLELATISDLGVRQRFEGFELLGLETRNKYQIISPKGRVVAYAAEHKTGILGTVLRQFLGHWRSFEIHFFNEKRELEFVVHHPFRWIFQRLDVLTPRGQALGSMEQGFTIFSRKFHLFNEQEKLLLVMTSPWWRVWTFPFKRAEVVVAEVQKKWTGVGTEIFTDRDNFHVNYLDQKLDVKEKFLILVAAVFIDLQYFESNQPAGLDLLDIVTPD